MLCIEWLRFANNQYDFIQFLLCSKCYLIFNVNSFFFFFFFLDIIDFVLYKYNFPVMVRRLKWIGHMAIAKGRIHQVIFSFIVSAVFYLVVSCLFTVFPCICELGIWRLKWIGFILSSCQGISMYLLVIWVQRLLMLIYLRASQSFLVARKFLVFCLSFFSSKMFRVKCKQSIL